MLKREPAPERTREALPVLNSVRLLSDFSRSELVQSARPDLVFKN